MSRCVNAVVLLLWITAHSSATNAQSRLGEVELVSEFPCPDPHVFHDGSDWYIFGTGAKPFFLQGKEFGEGKMKKVPLDLDLVGFGLPVAHIWGFVVHREADGSIHAYGTLHLGRFHTVIACFEPSDGTWEKGKPIRRWRFKRVVVGDPSRKDWHYYESKILEGPNHDRYLMYVATVGRDNLILAQRMRSWSELDPASRPRVLLRPEGYRSEDRNGPGSMQLVEGGSIFKAKSRYILLYSVGDYLLPTYKLGMAFSNSLIPPEGQTYGKVKLADPQRIWGKSGHSGEVGYLLQSERRRWPNFVGERVVGPGLGSIVPIDSKLWLFFHGYKADDRERRPENRFVFRVPVAIGLDSGPPSLKWVHAGASRAGTVASKKQINVLEAFKRFAVAGAVWEGTSGWGGGRVTKSELHCVKGGIESQWEFVFLEESIFNTPVPFRERWTGKTIKTGDEVTLRLTRHDGKAFHEYTINEKGELDGHDVKAGFTYRFKPKADRAGQ